MGYLHMKQATLPRGKSGKVYPIIVGSIHLFFANLGKRVEAEAPDMFKFSHQCGQLELRDGHDEAGYVKLCQLGMKTVVFHHSR